MMTPRLGFAPAGPVAEEFVALHAQLLETDMTSLNGADYRALNRQLKLLTDGPQLRIAYLGNVTLSLLPPFVAAHCAREGWLAQAHVGHFGQHFQELHNPELSSFAPDIVLLVLSLRLLRPDALAEFTARSASDRQAIRDDVLGEIEYWVKQALSATPATLLVSNFPLPAVPALGIADTADAYGETEFYLELNLELMRLLRAYNRVQILDVNRIASRLGHARAFDERMFHISKTDWTEAMMASVGQEIVRHVIGTKGTAKKCLALDIDNTLWGGVVGEEGPTGVKVGHGDAESEAFMTFQQRIRSLKDRGILLALCSKNNPADVEEAFRLRKEMPLKLEDFSALAIGWGPKHEGLAQIASELNIGIDAMVFIDDNPAEIALVRQMLPMVECVLLPSDPAAFVATLDELTSFEKSVVLADDINKALQYQQEAERVRFSSTHDSMGGYLAQLQMEVCISPVDAGSLQRVHQMFTKTNQFNVTTKRYPMGELEAMLQSPEHHLGMVSLRDRFGDLGIIAAFILVEEGSGLHIDSLLMSCRAMGRGVETAIMNFIKQQFSEREQLAVLTAEFAPTAKNKPAANYFLEQGFRPASEGAGMFYVLNKNDVDVKPCDWIKAKGASLWKTQKEYG
jgi:FkbH-like protein